MSNFVEILMGPAGVKVLSHSWWEIRGQGLSKTIEGAQRILSSHPQIKKGIRLRIHTHDYPTHAEGGRKERVELQTVSEMGGGKSLLPDWVFGGWWHMGMESWDPFVRDLASAGDMEPEDARVYWKGAHLGVRQREVYVDLCSLHPERFAGDFMNWGPNGTHNNFTPMRDQCRHAVLVDLTGVGYSGRLKMLAFTGRPLIVAGRRWWSWADQEILAQGLHFEAKEDLSDLKEVYDGILGDMGGARRRAAELRNYCLSEMTFEKACRQAADVIRHSVENGPKIL